MVNAMPKLWISKHDMIEVHEILCSIPFEPAKISDVEPPTKRHQGIERLIEQLASLIKQDNMKEDITTKQKIYEIIRKYPKGIKFKELQIICVRADQMNMISDEFYKCFKELMNEGKCYELEKGLIVPRFEDAQEQLKRA